ncbi:MAG: hypothetical protein APR53_04535 [Methanoculleus sp. SDB]|nr:MAG: hypothetical protein APR53_04535 [Methanoculleus sp. SDB]
MFSRFFAKKEESPLVIGFTDISRWVDDREIAVRNSLRDETAGSQTTIRAAFGELDTVIESLHEASPDPGAPPKLRRAVETAVPVFIRAMEIATGRHWSEDPVAFYQEAADALKGMIKAMKGQGKYLTALYPEEMKEMRVSVSAIGKEINTMTDRIAAADAELSSLEDVRKQHAAICRLEEDYGAAKARWQEIWSQIPKDERHLDAIHAEIARMKEEEDITGLSDAREAVERLELEKEELAIEYSRIVAASANVLRKAEHAAESGHKEELIRAIRHVRKLLAHPPRHDRVTLTEGISVIIPDLMQMIEQGEVILKNKSEQKMFADGQRLIDIVGGLCTQYGHTTEQLALARLRVTESDVLQRLSHLEEKKAELERKHRNDEEQMKAFEVFFEETIGKIPDKIAALEEALAGCAGKPVKITGPVPGIPEYTSGTDIPSAGN